MNWIDTHAHIYAEQFQKDLDTCISRAKDAGLSSILMPNIDIKSIEPMLQLEKDYPGYCIPIMGLHPCAVKENFEDDLAIIKKWLDQRDFIAVGEIGIDLYWDKTFFEQQVEAFKIQCQWAIERDVPIVIHARDSMSELIQVVSEIKTEKLRGVFHCFGGTVEEANQIIDLGFYLGIGGVATFKKAGLDQVLPHIDAKHLIMETDCPYLAPVPYRGKRNECSYIPIIGEKVASYTDYSIEEIAAATTANAQNLFAL